MHIRPLSENLTNELILIRFLEFRNVLKYYVGSGGLI